MNYSVIDTLFGAIVFTSADVAEAVDHLEAVNFGENEGRFVLTNRMAKVTAEGEPGLDEFFAALING